MGNKYSTHSKNHSSKVQSSKFDKNIVIHDEDGMVHSFETNANGQKTNGLLNHRFQTDDDMKHKTGMCAAGDFAESLQRQDSKMNKKSPESNSDSNKVSNSNVWKSVSEHLCYKVDEDEDVEKFRSTVVTKRPSQISISGRKKSLVFQAGLKKEQSSSISGNSADLESCDKDDGDEKQKALCELIVKLQDGEDWCVVLGQISKIVRTWQHPKDVSEILIENNFVGKLEVFLDKHHVSSFETLKLGDESTSKVWPVVKRFLIIFWITCDRNVNFCQYLLGSKVFLFLVSELRILSSENYEHYEIFLFIIKSILGILHNISRHVPNSKWNLRNEGLVTIIRTYLPSEIPMVRLKSLIVLSYLLSEAENEIINSDDDNFVFIFKVLSDALSFPEHKSSKYGMNASEVLKGINNLAINDENKIRIVRNGALPLYQDILKDGFPDEIKITIMTLWSLAFHHYNKRKMREMPGIMGKLFELRQCDDEEICHAARGTFWELENTSKSALGKNFSSSAEKDPHQPHIMISYQWDSQQIMLKVKDRLKHAGYKVWMDVEHMSGSTLEAMALAVEKAAVVLICMSEKYKNSPNCRTEAEYVYRLRKDFVPLRLQQEYVPDGWLGILVGTRLYFDIYSEELLDYQLPKLMKELSDRGRISPSLDFSDQGYMLPRRLMSREAVPVLHQPAGTEVMNWTGHDVTDWLKLAGITDVHEKLLNLDGQLLLELQKIQKTAPEFFYTILRTDLGLSTIMILKFSRALRILR